MRFQDAVESMQGERQKILAEASADINHRLGIQGHEVTCTRFTTGC